MHICIMDIIKDLPGYWMRMQDLVTSGAFSTLIVSEDQFDLVQVENLTQLQEEVWERGAPDTVCLKIAANKTEQEGKFSRYHPSCITKCKTDPSLFPYMGFMNFPNEYNGATNRNT